MSECPDCPDLADSPDRPKGKLRASCCRDDFVEARKAGEFEGGWPGLPEGRKMMDEFEAVLSKAGFPAPHPGGPRRERRAAAAKARKKK